LILSPFWDYALLGVSRRSLIEPDRIARSGGVKEGVMAEVECVMLAAGRSSRMDDWKMTLPWGKSTIVEHSVRTALNVCARVVLVAGFRAEELDGPYTKIFWAGTGSWLRFCLQQVRPTQ
jgi:hypothetical protein